MFIPQLPPRPKTLLPQQIRRGRGGREGRKPPHSPKLLPLLMHLDQLPKQLGQAGCVLPFYTHTNKFFTQYCILLGLGLRIEAKYCTAPYMSLLHCVRAHTVFTCTIAFSDAPSTFMHGVIDTYAIKCPMRTTLEVFFFFFFLGWSGTALSCFHRLSVLQYGPGFCSACPVVLPSVKLELKENPGLAC